MAPSDSVPQPAISDEDLAAFFGDKASYYLIEKEVLERSGSRISWNWPAFLFNFLWMYYRKMWAQATLTAFISIILSASIVFNWGVGIVMLVVGMYGNGIYVTHARKKVAEIDVAGVNPDQRLESLAKAGGTTWLPVVIGLFVIIGLTILFIVLWGGVVLTVLGGWMWWGLFTDP